VDETDPNMPAMERQARLTSGMPPIATRKRT
jgi:hypothetical protein